MKAREQFLIRRPLNLTRDHPDHQSVFGVMYCPICWPKFLEHTRRLEKRGNP